MAPPPMYVAPRPRSWFGAIMLIALGVVFLLVSMGRITPGRVFVWFALYWPVILIVWGLLKLLEHAQARSAGQPARGIGAGGVVLMVLLLIFGSAATAAYHASSHVNWDNLRDNIQIDDDTNLSSIFEGKKYEFADSLVQEFPAKGRLTVNGGHGDVKLQPSTDGKLHVDYTRVVYANDDAEANRLKGVVNPLVTMEGGVVAIDTSHNNGWKGARLNLVISIPAKAAAEVVVQHGAVDASDLGGVKLTTQHGDVSLTNITGDSEVHLQHGDIKAENVKGDLALEGRVNDADISDVTGLLKCDGDFFGEMKLAHIAKGLQFKSSRTDLQFAKLDGDFDMSGSDLRITTVSGPLRMVTKSKDVNISDLSGDAHLEDRDGEVVVQSKAPLGNIEITDKHGEVRVVVPPQSSFQLDAKTLHGDIETDFGISSSESGNETSAAGTVGKGGPRVQISNEDGTIRVKKG